MRVPRLLVAFALSLLASAAADPAAAQQKDRLTLGMGLEPPHLDPTAGAAAAIDEVTYANLFEGLVRIDRAGKVAPQLARSWTVSPDGLTSPNLGNFEFRNVVRPLFPLDADAGWTPPAW